MKEIIISLPWIVAGVVICHKLIKTLWALSSDERFNVFEDKFNNLKADRPPEVDAAVSAFGGFRSVVTIFALVLTSLLIADVLAWNYFVN